MIHHSLVTHHSGTQKMQRSSLPMWKGDKFVFVCFIYHFYSSTFQQVCTKSKNKYSQVPKRIERVPKSTKKVPKSLPGSTWIHYGQPGATWVYLGVKTLIAIPSTIAGCHY